jgi:predicted nucleotidyltransferase
MDIQLREHLLNELRGLIIDTLFQEDVRVYLFGSWARNEEKHSSDIDIAVEQVTPLSLSKWTELMDKVEESTIPYRVDIVNLNNASEAFIQNVKREGILWQDCRSD